MASATELLSWVKGYLDRSGYKYEEVEREDRNNFIKTIFTLDGKLKESRLFFFFYDGFYFCHITIISHINYLLIIYYSQSNNYNTIIT